MRDVPAQGAMAAKQLPMGCLCAVTDAQDFYRVYLDAMRDD
jgi:hypothetical protein